MALEQPEKIERGQRRQRARHQRNRGDHYCVAIAYLRHNDISPALKLRSPSKRGRPATIGPKGRRRVDIEYVPLCVQGCAVDAAAAGKHS